MTNEQTREQFLLALNSNAYLNMCTCDDMKNVIEALDKQITMKISMVYDDEVKTYWCFCPNCNKSLGWVHTVKSNYCSECGQKLRK